MTLLDLLPPEIAEIWQMASRAERGPLLDDLFEHAWADLRLHLQPTPAAYPVPAELLPKRLVLARMHGNFGVAVTEARDRDLATMADLTRAIAIACEDVLKAAATLKAMACVGAQRLLDGATYADLVFPDGDARPN